MNLNTYLIINKAEHAVQSYAAGTNFYGALLEYAMHAEHMLSNEHMLLKCWAYATNMLTIYYKHTNYMHECSKNVPSKC